MWRRSLPLLLGLLATACSAPATQQQTADAEIARLAPLKSQYKNVVMGFDVQHDTTLVVSLDLQNYIGMDDNTVDAMKSDTVKRWRTTWKSAHPHAHATLHVRFIDFVGRKVAEESTHV